ncbi:hypothetical protein ABT297_35315 [Dactylosporangium sp. NPDC000555]|uniref:hypothetical protein n=1 Tax=Dactylosporangium sp. NPDC000555 TaxID=3154260 RepID=UPI00331C8849
MTNPPQNPDDEPRSEPFRPMSYDLAPEFGTPPPANNAGPYPGAVPPVSAQPGHPGPGQPGYPVSGQPAYPVSGVAGQPGYPSSQPGYPVSAQPSAYQQPAYQQPPAYQPGPAFPPPPPPKKGKGLKITLGVLGGLFLVCAIAACALFYPFFAEGTSHVSAPATLPGNLTKQTSDSSKSLADSLESDLRKDISGIQEVAVGVYAPGDNDLQHTVVVAAATGSFLFPSSQVDDAFSGFTSSSSDSLGTPKSYDAGRLGGTVKCADGTSSSGAFDKFAMCVWADHGSVGLVLFFGRDAGESASLFIQIREVVQTRS